MNFIVWLLVFIGLFLNLIWVSFYYVYDTPKQRRSKSVPVTIAIPAYNEEHEIIRTLTSVLALDYPKNRLDVIVVDDGSTDRTQHVVKKFLKTHKYGNVRLLSKKNGGKGSALNHAIKHTTTPYWGCVDADSEVHPDALKNLLHHFDDPKVAAVITAIKPRNKQTLMERLQRFEYLLSILFRTLRSNVGTLAITPGALSVYRTNVLEEVNGFDESKNNLTEDFEIALAIKKHHYLIKLEPSSVTQTQIPRTFKEHYQQQVRWFRGFIHNNIKHRDLFFKRGQGLFGWFDFPVGVLGVITLLAGMAWLFYNTGKNMFEFWLRMFRIDGYLTRLLSWPRVETVLLGHNEKFLIPAMIVLGLALYLLYVAHKHARENIMAPHILALYVVCYPFLAMIYWVSATYKELMGSEREWHGIGP